jgi:hypothetical protein
VAFWRAADGACDRGGVAGVWAGLDCGPADRVSKGHRWAEWAEKQAVFIIFYAKGSIFERSPTIGPWRPIADGNQLYCL